MKILFTVIALMVSSTVLAAQGAIAQDDKEQEAILVARKAFEDGFYEVSLGLLERFFKDYPHSPGVAEANLLVGQCYFHQDKFLDALTKFEETLNQPQAENIKDSLFYWIAEVHFKGNAFSRAAEYYRKVIDGFPASAYLGPAYYSLGWCLFQEQNFSEALKYFKITEEKFSHQPQAQDSTFKIIECLYNLRDYASLKGQITSYLKAGPRSNKGPYLYFYLAEADYYLNNFNEAIDEYSKVILDFNDEKAKALARLGMGWAYLKLKRYKDAQGVFLEIKKEGLDKKSQDALLLARAILMAETNRFPEARDLYNELLVSAVDQDTLIQAYLGKADALYNLGEYKEAVSVYRESLDKATGATSGEIIDKLHYGLAWSFLKEGNFKEAIDEFKKIVKNSEDRTVKIAALCQIGDMYQESGDYAKAAQVYSDILRDYPDSIYSDYMQYQLGLTFLKSDNYDAAVMAFQSLKNNFPNSKLLDDASYALGLAYFQREDYASSKEIFETFQNEFRDSSLRPQAMYLLGSSLYNRGKFPEAVEVFKGIIRMYGQDTGLVQKAEYEIADCYYQMGNEKEAMNRFKSLRSKYPDSSLTAEVMWWLGEYYYRHSDLGLARRYFSSLIKDFPKSKLVPSAYYALASTYDSEDKYPEAIDNFNKVIATDKSDLAGTAAVAIADIYVKEHKLSSALEGYKDILVKYTNLAHLAYPKIADIYRKTGNFEEALSFYRKSLEEVPVKEMAAIQFYIAETLEAQGKDEEAAGEYLKVTYLYSESDNLAVKSLLRAAAIYENRERFKEAVKIYKKVSLMNIEESKYAQERISWINTRIK